MVKMSERKGKPGQPNRNHGCPAQSKLGLQSQCHFRQLRFEFKELHRVQSAYLDLVFQRDINRPEPFLALNHAFVGIIGRVQDAVGPHLKNSVDQRLSAEGAARCDKEVLVKINRGLLVDLHSARVHHLTVLKAPNCEWKHFTQMAQNDLKPGIFVKQSTSDQSECMRSRLYTESPRSTEQPGMSFIGLLLAGKWLARMQINRYV